MNIYFTFPIGQSIRDHIHLGTVDKLQELMPGARILALSPAYNVPEFVDLCTQHNLVPRRAENRTSAGRNERLVRLRKRLNSSFLKKRVLKWEVNRYEIPPYIRKTFEEYPPDAVVLSHPMTSHNYAVYMAAVKYGIPTLGIVNSWDNLRKRIAQWADHLSVWNQINYEEALSMNSYSPDQVTINGPVSFDPFWDSTAWDSREIAAEKLGMNPSKKWIVYATSGVYNLEYYGRDETWLVHEIVEWMHRNPAFENTQLLIRLHPVSRLIDFKPLAAQYPDIRFSYGKYLPAIGWYTDREDYRQQINILKHSDVIITPGSSWTIEGAVMDTPVVVPVYATLQPEHAAAQFDRYTLARHFKPILENKWVPVTRSNEETEAAMAEALTDPAAGREKRRQLVDNYVHLRDGKAAERVAQWIARIVQKQ